MSEAPKMTCNHQTAHVKFKKLHPDAVAPKKATAGSSGFDLVSIEEVYIQAGDRALVGTGISIQLPVGYEAQVRSRSGLAAKQGVSVLNSPGTIDQDFSGQVGVILHNSGSSLYYVRKGDRIAQLVVQVVPEVVFEEVEELDPTDRGAGGFGSTGQ